MGLTLFKTFMPSQNLQPLLGIEAGTIFNQIEISDLRTKKSSHDMYQQAYLAIKWGFAYKATDNLSFTLTAKPTYVEWFSELPPIEAFPINTNSHLMMPVQIGVLLKL